MTSVFRLVKYSNPSHDSNRFFYLFSCFAETLAADGLIDLILKMPISDHVCHIPRRWTSSKIFVKPIQVGVVIEGHRAYRIGPVAVVWKYDQPRWHIHFLQIGEEMQTLCIGNTVIELTGNDQTGCFEVFDKIGW